eukprot:NODE_99_length_20944_cov_0.552746.p9 type:complete len:120 gc:universal NODE_99_length_20944_cov_0.552746:1089-730(-)
MNLSIQVSTTLVFLGYILLLFTQIIFFNVWNLVFVTFGILLGFIGLFRKRTKYINCAKIFLCCTSLLIITFLFILSPIDDFPSVIPMSNVAKLCILFGLHFVSMSFIFIGSNNYYRYYD